MAGHRIFATPFARIVLVLLPAAAAALSCSAPRTASPTDTVGSRERSTESAADRQVDPAIRTLLAYSEVKSVLGGVNDGIAAALEERGIEPSPEQEATLARRLSMEVLVPIMEQELDDLGDPAMRAAAAELVQEGPLATIRAMVEERPPASTFEEFVASLRTDPPPAARVRLVSDLAAAQSAGSFYIFMDERIREAAHGIARTLGGRPEPFDPVSREEWDLRTELAHRQALVSFLHRYQNVPDTLLVSALEDWRSEPGAWFVAAYSTALGSTILAAGDSAEAALRR